MHKFYWAVVKGRKILLPAFLLTAVLCGLLQNFVAVNYDMKDYLPEDSPSTTALDLMAEEYDGGIPNARVMLRDVTIPEALTYKEKFLAIPGVTDVTWLDNAADVFTPLEAQDQDLIDQYYQNGNALFSVTIEEESVLSAVSALRDIIGEKGAMSGDAISTAVATESTVSEIQKIAGIAVALTLLVLTLTTASWLEPFLILTGLGVAILINAGSNLIFGEISFVTNAAGSILQLAVSLDYSFFLMHRYEACKEEYTDRQEAMVEALCASTSSILSSGLTTVIGFLALVFMRFGIGPDLGLALAKGIAISLLTVFLFMPALFLAADRLNRRLAHRSFLPSFRPFGRLVRRLMLPLAGMFAVVILPSYLASNANAFYYGSAYIFDETTQLGADIREIESVFGRQDTYVLLVPQGNTAQETTLSEALSSLPQVDSILSFVDAAGAEIPPDYLDEETRSKLISEHYSRLVLTMDVPPEGEEAFQAVEAVRETAEAYYPGQWHLAGNGVSTYDLMDTITADMVKVNGIAIGAVFLVLLITMKKLVLPALLVLTIETAIWINLSIPYFQGETVFYIAYLIISSIQLGATVDYAILFTDRYRDFRRTTDKGQAVEETIGEVSVSILTSGSLLTVVGYLLGNLSSHGLLAQLGIFLGQGALLSLLMVLFVLPGLLYLFDRTFCKKESLTHETESNETTVGHPADLRPASGPVCPRPGHRRRWGQHQGGSRLHKP